MNEEGILLASEIKQLPQRHLTDQERETQTSKLKIKRKENEEVPSHHLLLLTSGEQKDQMTGKCLFLEQVTETQLTVGLIPQLRTQQMTD